MTEETQKPTVLREFVHATYVTNMEDKSEDAVFVKETIHKDGKLIPNFRCIVNYVRDFYVVKKQFRTYKDKHEYEDIRKLEKYSTTQRNMPYKAFQALSGFRANRYVGMNDLPNSQYLYGSDISTPSLIAHEYKKRYPTAVSKKSLMVMDYEWDVVNNTDEILCGVVSMKEVVHVAVTRDFLGIWGPTAQQDFKAACELYLGDIIKERNLNIQLTIEDNAGQVPLQLLKTAHKHKPDFLGFWNMKNDIIHILDAFKKYNIDPAEAFSDPSVPHHYKMFKWVIDKEVKETSGGKRKPKHMADLWHTVSTPASFYCICQMALFRTIRARDQQRSTYDLDGVMEEYINRKKLKIGSAPAGLCQLDWHKYMQKNCPIEYLVYLVFDGVGPEMLDEVTSDVSRGISAFIGISELQKFKSNPKRLVDDKHFKFLEDGVVIGSTSKDMRVELDSETHSLNGWIQTLPSELTHKIGLPLLKEFPMLDTNTMVHAKDVDVEGAYPAGQRAGNVSKTTCKMEMCSIDRLGHDETRRLGINLTSVRFNCLSLAKAAYGYPHEETLLAGFLKEIG